MRNFYLNLIKVLKVISHYLLWLKHDILLGLAEDYITVKVRLVALKGHVLTLSRKDRDILAYFINGKVVKGLLTIKKNEVEDVIAKSLSFICLWDIEGRDEEDIRLNLALKVIS